MSRLDAELRRFAYLGARYGPKWWLRFSPTPLGAVACLLSARGRGAVCDRLSWMLGHKVSPFAALPSFINFAHCLAETLGVEGHPVEFESHGVETLSQLVRHDKGFILATAHTGAWELAATELSSVVSRDVVLVMTSEQNDGARGIHERVRERRGVRAVYVGDSPLVGLTLISELRQGHVLAFQIDRPPGSGRTLGTRLFGRPFRVPEGPFRLARAASLPVIPVFCSRSGFLHHRLDVLAPIHVERRATQSALLQAAQELVHGFETFVRRVPNQWFDFEPRAGLATGASFD